MFQSLCPPRLRRTLVAASALSLCALAHAAVPAVSASASPFGVDASGHFEPSVPLAGAGWQLLAANTRRAADKAVAVAPTAAAPVDAAAAPATRVAPASDIAVVAVPAALVATVAAARTAAPDVPAIWKVTPADGNFRQLIESWAPRAGWTAAPWELEKDVPIVGNDAFEGDFKSAVRRVLSSTEMTDYIIKPCFYSNHVVRVVKQTTKCDLSK